MRAQVGVHMGDLGSGANAVQGRLQGELRQRQREGSTFASRRHCSRTCKRVLQQSRGLVTVHIPQGKLCTYIYRKAKNCTTQSGAKMSAASATCPCRRGNSPGTRKIYAVDTRSRHATDTPSQHRAPTHRHRAHLTTRVAAWLFLAAQRRHTPRHVHPSLKPTPMHAHRAPE